MDRSSVPDEVVTVKLFADVAVPPGLVTAIFPVLVPLATVAVICVALFTTYVAALPLNVTAVVPVKFVPVTTTPVPTGPVVGVKLVIVGGTTTVNAFAEVAVPPAVVTEIFPLVVPLATVAVICVALFTANVAALPLNATAVAPVKFVPVITTEVPTTPDAGAKLAIVGAATTVNALADVAEDSGLATVMGPLVVPAATVAVICVALFTVNPLAGVPLNATAVMPVRLVPVITTDVPTGPLVGTKLVMAGGIWIVKAMLDVAVPPGVVTVIMPVLVPDATVAVI